MKKFLASFLKKILIKVESTPSQSLEIKNKKPQKKTRYKNHLTSQISLDRLPQSYSSRPQEIIPRDFAEMMEVPFLALSKNRITPILYENPERGIKVNITRHTGHFLASIYDWDIVVFAESKMQEILNSGNHIPPRTMTFPRHEILKALGKHDGKKEEKDLRASLSRLKLTGIETTIRNEDYRYEAGFGFLDSWGYTERKDIREIHITLSQWLYDGICAKGALLKVSNEYFELTSGIKRFLYRTARKHAGQNEGSWEFSIEKLYEKSGSEREFKKFKSDLKIAVRANDIPEYDLMWVERNKNAFVSFKRRKDKSLLK
jgi:plasmid replication initiation protein